MFARKNLPSRLSQNHVIPVKKWAIVKSIKGLKSKSLDIDGISVLNLVPNSFELVSHLQLFFFQMCLSNSCVPDAFSCGSVMSLLKKGKELVSCTSYSP